MYRCPLALLLLLVLLLLGEGGQAYELAELVEGSLEADTVNYYTVDATGVLVVALLTEEGDADLYVSTETKEPGHSNYQLSSATCGLDFVVVPTGKGAESQRVYLGVLGHSHHAKSRYKLAIIATSSQDIDKYQVWDLDHETRRRVLLVNYDPMQIANDVTLHQLLDQLQGNSAGVKGDSTEGVLGSQTCC